jgi:hypothetical protein
VRHRLGDSAADAFSGGSVRLSVGRHYEGGEEGGGGVAAAEHGSNQDHVTRHPALQHERVANWEQGQQLRVFAILEIHHEPIHVARAGELEGGAAERKDVPARVHVEAGALCCTNSRDIVFFQHLSSDQACFTKQKIWQDLRFEMSNWSESPTDTDASLAQSIPLQFAISSATAFDLNAAAQGW